MNNSAGDKFAILEEIVKVVPVVASPPEVAIEIEFEIVMVAAVDTRVPVVKVIPPVPELICPKSAIERVPPVMFVPPV
jgi:hypothetical protein